MDQITAQTKKLKNESSDDSDDGIHKILPKRPELMKQSKNGALWKEMLEEESLMQDMKTCEVGRNFRKRKIDRGAESYDYEGHDESDKRPKYHEDNPQSSVFTDRKKFKGTRTSHFVDQSPKYLQDLSDNVEDDKFTEDVASKLEEENLDVIKRVITAIGKDECISYFKKTQKIESKGGLLTVNKQRRRTSGGIFLFLIKTSNKLSPEQKNIIFEKNTES